MRSRYLKARTPARSRRIGQIALMTVALTSVAATVLTGPSASAGSSSNRLGSAGGGSSPEGTLNDATQAHLSADPGPSRSATTSMVLPSPSEAKAPSGESGGCKTPGAFCVTNHMLTVYSNVLTPGCSYVSHIDWGDRTPPTTFTFTVSGITRTHTYKRGGLYHLEATGTSTPIVSGLTCVFKPFSALVEVPPDKFTVTGKIPYTIQTPPAPANSDQATGNQKLAQQCLTRSGQREFLFDELLAHNIVDTMVKSGAPHGAELLVHFLDGTGSPVSYAEGSSLAAEVKASTRFKALDKAVQAEAKRKLDVAQQNVIGEQNVIVSSSLKTIDFTFGSDQSNWDLYLAFGGTQGLKVDSEGLFPIEGRYVGTITYVIQDTYGFSTAPKFLGVGPQMHYLQTVCGAPDFQGGAQWFPTSLTVTVPFDQPVTP